MKLLPTKEKQKWSNEVPFEGAPDLVTEILNYWQSKKGSHKIPLKSDIFPWEISKHMGRVCILEIKADPLDFIYRLDGSSVTAATIENLTGKSILESNPPDFALSAYMDMAEVHQRDEPILWCVKMQHEKRHYEYLRLILPLSREGDDFSFLMTYSHRLGLLSGSLPRAYGNDVPSGIYD